MILVVHKTAFKHFLSIDVLVEETEEFELFECCYKDIYCSIAFKLIQKHLKEYSILFSCDFEYKEFDNEKCLEKLKETIFPKIKKVIVVGQWNVRKGLIDEKLKKEIEKLKVPIETLDEKDFKD